MYVISAKTLLQPCSPTTHLLSRFNMRPEGIELIINILRITINHVKLLPHNIRLSKVPQIRHQQVQLPLTFQQRVEMVITEQHRKLVLF